MKPATRDRLLALNRQFYTAVAEPFHSTRGSWPQGNIQLLDHLSLDAPTRCPLRVLDAGCGNGRFAAILDSLGVAVHYTGIDANRQLLDLARPTAADLHHVKAEFVQADLSDTSWVQHLGRPSPSFELVVCLSTLQHMPGQALRRQVLESLAALLVPGGRIAISAWQFLTSPRLAERQIDWATQGVDEHDVEPGDALLPWKQDVYAVRYVHQIDLAEMRTLAADAGLCIRHTFLADGREGNLNLYAIMQHGTPTEQEI